LKNALDNAPQVKYITSNWYCLVLIQSLGRIMRISYRKTESAQLEAMKNNIRGAMLTSIPVNETIIEK